MGWHVTFYNEKVEDETLSFPKGILANLLHIIEMMLQFGPSLGNHTQNHLEKALKKAEVKREYDRLTTTYNLRKQLIEIRLKSGLTQEELAKILHTKKSNISRLESANSKISPKLSTIEEYAKAVGYKLEINFVPHTN